MDEMNLSEQVKAAKEECEEKIYAALKEFEDETGFIVSELALCEEQGLNRFGCPSFVRFVNIKLGI